MLNLAAYYRDRHQPDILDCIANLSSDEVFTPPELADKILDLLPTEIWSNPELTFLDPACKTGIFLRQIATRLMEGLKDVIPDEDARREHIFKKQLYGIPITQLTAYISRRTVYYSKDTTSEASVVHFDQPDGHIPYAPTQHTFVSGKCTYCGQAEGEGVGARQIDGSLETHAYKLIHLTEEEARTMKFDVIVGNPPYQLNDGGGTGASATPIYHKFIEQARALKPRYMAFITPSRWFAGGKGLDSFRAGMLSDRHIKELVDYPNASDCFPGVEIKGGVSYFVWDADYDGDCNVRTIIGDTEFKPVKRYLNEYDVFIRMNEAVPILKKVRARSEATLDRVVSSRKPFGFISSFKDYDQIDNPDKVKIYAKDGKTGYIRRERVQQNTQLIDRWKVLTGKAGSVNGVYPNKITGTTLAVPPRSVCTESYLVANHFTDEMSANNFESYVKTKFFRFLLSLKTPTQNISKDCLGFIPDLPMTETWTDEKLYERYDINADEQAFIESMIKEMT